MKKVKMQKFGWDLLDPNTLSTIGVFHGGGEELEVLKEVTIKGTDYYLVEAEVAGTDSNLTTKKGLVKKVAFE